MSKPSIVRIKVKDFIEQTGEKTREQIIDYVLGLAQSSPDIDNSISEIDCDNWRIVPSRQIVSLAENWLLPDEWGEHAERLGWKKKDILIQAERFKFYWRCGKGKGRRRTVRGWQTAWSNWLDIASRRV